MKENVKTAVRKFKRNEKILLSYWENILKRILVITSSNTTILSFKTLNEIKVKLRYVKWEQYFIEIKTMLVHIPITTLCPGSNPTSNSNEDENIVLANDIETIRI